MTRKQYMDRCGEPGAHREYYGQFVTEGTRSLVRIRLGERILASKDPHFNDIPLQEWDSMAYLLGNTARLMNIMGDYFTLAGAVCVLKEAAEQVREGGR